MPLCFVSIGSNIDRERNVSGAIASLREHFGPLLVSAVYETPAVGFTGDAFYNLVAAFFTERSPPDVARILSTIEFAYGRRRNDERFSPRTLDIDLLLYDEMVTQEAGLQLPRPDMVEYAFVLEPLAEIAPDLKHPQTGQTIQSLREKLTTSSLAAKPARLPIE